MNELISHWSSAQAQALEYAWGEYRVWSATARQKKQEITQWRFSVLIFSVTGGMLGTLSSQFTELSGMLGTLSSQVKELSSVIIGLAGTGFISAAAYLGQEILKPDQERLFARARSVAEALKGTIFLFRIGAPPYDVPEPTPILMQRVQELLNQVKDLPAVNLTPGQKLENLPEGRLTVENYVRERIEDQVDDFYKPRIKKYEKLLNHWRLINFCISLLAAFLGVLGKWTAAWVAVLTTLGTSVAAYIFANRYQYLLVSYQATARQLEFFKNEWLLMGAPEKNLEKRNRFILNCEATISTENSAWMAKLLEKPKEA